VAAREAFAEGGESTALEEIARRAGVGIGTLYRHFPNRQALLEALYVNEVEEVCRSAAELDGGDPWEALNSWFRRLMGYLATKQALANVPSLALLAPQLQASAASSSAPFSQLTSLLPMLGTTASTTVPGGATTQIDVATQQAIQTAVTAATASMQTELAALRTQVAQLAAKGA